MSRFRLNVSMVLGSSLIFLLSFLANQWLFTSSEFIRGINWIYLPAGIRLLCTLLFGAAGAIGVMITSWITCFFYFFPDDPVRSFIGGIISAAAPYLTYRLAQYAFGLRASLTNLTTGRLLFLILLYSLASPSLHHLWFLARNDDVSAAGYCVMVIGDLLGSLMVVYTMKMLLSFLPPKAANVR
ncbi:MAG: hypothetical protein JWQ23_1461 [Herminiimonas sp.]|nr:hypothetical protein [Herminiimonas sp.]